MCMPITFGTKLIDGKKIDNKKSKNNKKQTKEVIIQTSVEFEEERKN